MSVFQRLVSQTKDAKQLYFKSMNKIKLFFAAMLMCAATVSADVNTPYSMYGYGIIGDRATSMQRQMGGVGYAMNSGRQINVMNPASYAAIDSLTFLFDIGADVSMLWSKEGATKKSSVGGGVDYVTMQFPICKFMGGSLGLVPYSNVGYAFGNEIQHGTVENQGSGGINQLYLGLSGKVAGLSIGANVSYDFGTIVQDVFSQPTNTSSQMKYERVLEIRDWNINVGLQYTLKWNRWHKLVVGATWSPKKQLHGKTFGTKQSVSQDTYPDTVAYQRLGKDGYKMYTPNTYGAGISYTFEKSYRLMVEADFTFQNWSKTPIPALVGKVINVGGKEEETLVYSGAQFNDRTKYAVGAEFIPRLRGNYAERMTYRLGGYYTNDYIKVNGNSVREYGVTAGFGFPTPEGKTMINLGLEWKKRYATPSPLLTENYFNITLGVNFNEVWFWKRKIR